MVLHNTWYLEGMEGVEGKNEVSKIYTVSCVTLQIDS